MTRTKEYCAAKNILKKEYPEILDVPPEVKATIMRGITDEMTTLQNDKSRPWPRGSDIILYELQEDSPVSVKRLTLTFFMKSDGPRIFGMKEKIKNRFELVALIRSKPTIIYNTDDVYDIFNLLNLGEVVKEE